MQDEENGFSAQYKNGSQQNNTLAKPVGWLTTFSANNEGAVLIGF